MWDSKSINRRGFLIFLSVGLGAIVGRFCGSCFVRLADYDASTNRLYEMAFRTSRSTTMTMTNDLSFSTTPTLNNDRRRRLGETILAGGTNNNNARLPQQNAKQTTTTTSSRRRHLKQHSRKGGKSNAGQTQNKQQQVTPAATEEDSDSLLPRTKPTLWVHLGMATTGMETFQQTLGAHRQELQQLGWDVYLPHAEDVRSGDCVAISLLHPDKNWLPPYCKKGMKSRDSYKIQLQNDLGTTYKDTKILLTGEHFANLDTTAQSVVSALEEFLAIVGRTHQIKISMMYREKESMFARFYTEIYEETPHLTGTALPQLLKNRPSMMYVNNTMSGWDKQVYDGDIHIYSYEELAERHKDMFQLFVEEHVASPDRATFLRKYQPNYSKTRFSIWKASKGFAVRSVAYDMGLTKEDVETCIDLEKTNTIYGRFPKKCFHHNRLWDSWMEEELQYMHGNSVGHHNFNLKHLPIRLYPSHGGARAVSEWCEVDRKNETMYDVGKMQEAIRGAASGLCLDKIMIDQ